LCVTQKTMSLFSQGKLVGIATHDEESSSLQLGEFQDQSPFYFNTSNALREIAPNVIVMSSQIDEDFSKFLKKYQDDGNASFEIEIVRSAEFSYQFALGRLMLIDLPGGDDLSFHEKKRIILSRIGSSGETSVCSLFILHAAIYETEENPVFL
jgi:hypothetical protein